jgi:glycosyltransferase involved in cell wall biosynthesis
MTEPSMPLGEIPANRERPTLAIVVPCYNEVEALDRTLKTLPECLRDLEARGLVSDESFVYCVDDGSRDGTWEKLVKAHRNAPRQVKGAKLAANVGHQRALLAGMLAVGPRADCVITIDADLQDDVGVIPDMVAAYREGCEIVYGVRRRRAADSALKRWTALGFYEVIERLGVAIVKNHSDFRLLGARALASLSRYEEANLFLRGILPILGFRTAQVYYDRLPRTAGSSKYPLGRMLSFAWTGIASFSVAPLRLIMAVAVVFFAMALGLAAYAIHGFAVGRTIPGWTSIVLPLYLLGAVQLLALAVIAEYVGQIYAEAKRRPRFTIETELF